MGMSSGGGGGKGVSSDINVTPLIDVLLVLLIIFLLVIPIMMKMEPLNIPRKLENDEIPSESSVVYTIKVRTDQSMVIHDGNTDVPVTMSTLSDTLRPKIENMKTNDKVVFVDFEDGCLWEHVVSTMDNIRAIASPENRDEVKVALKLKEPVGEQP
jgi:biopolymer transport protein TolR